MEIDDNFKRKIENENKRFNNIITNSKLKYKKNFIFFYDDMIIEDFRNKFPDKVKIFEKRALKKEPWLKYQRKNLKQRVDRMIFPSLLEKREGVSRKGVGAHLVHLSYSENHESKMCDYGDLPSCRGDINYGSHFELSDIIAERSGKIHLENQSITCDPSLINSPHHEDCLDRLKEADPGIKRDGLEKVIISMYKNEETAESILDNLSEYNISLSVIKKHIQKYEDYEAICMSYGLRGYKSRTQEDIARILKITQPAVVKRINKARLRLADIYKQLDLETNDEEEKDSDFTY